MVPFFNVGTLTEGPAAKALGGADISFLIGPPVAAILYYVFARSIDVAAETRVAQAEKTNSRPPRPSTNCPDHCPPVPAGGCRRSRRGLPPVPPGVARGWAR